jgi:hypothetical protein
MKPLRLGLDASGNDLTLSPTARRNTHMHVIGGSGTGKSKFLEWLIRQDIHEGRGLCVIDWHGTLYKNILEWCGHLDVGLLNDYRKLILLDPSASTSVTGFNPFMNIGADVATQVNRRIAATVKPWGEKNTNEMPTFERVCRLVYTFAVEQKETLPNASYLLEFDRPDLRELAAETAGDSRIRAQWRRLTRITTSREWDEQVLSTDNRLTRFLTSRTIRRFMGLPTGNIDVRRAMDRGHIVLVNLGDSDFLSRDEARLFAALFLNEFFETTMRRAAGLRPGREASPFILYLDEFQEYITDDLSAMLDEVRKGGLHMVLAHQHLGHFLENPRLRKSVLTNARIRAVFGGLDYEDASLLANEMFLPDLNTRQIKKAYYHTIHLYREETRRVYGSSSGSNTLMNAGTSSTSGENVPQAVEGWFERTPGATFQATSTNETCGMGTSETYSEVEVPIFVPVPVKELGSESEWSREEKVSKVAELLKEQQQRHCFIKLDTERTQPMKIPLVRRYAVGPETLFAYENDVYRAQGALAAGEVDRMIEDRALQFLNPRTPPEADEPFSCAESTVKPSKPKKNKR